MVEGELAHRQDLPYLREHLQLRVVLRVRRVGHRHESVVRSIADTLDSSGFRELFSRGKLMSWTRAWARKLGKWRAWVIFGWHSQHKSRAPPFGVLDAESPVWGILRGVQAPPRTLPNGVTSDLLGSTSSNHRAPKGYVPRQELQHRHAPWPV